ncbi:MAG: DUF547 domain-containing protein [bacterium]|nr:MAG: DUF547 domain-containing protein [bacterium]
MSRIFDRYVSKAREILSRNWTGSYTKPSPSLYPHQWNWDTGFIAIGKAHYDTREAEAELRALFSAQWSNGMLPQIVFNPEALGHYFPEPDFWRTDRSPHAPAGKMTSGITMPPLHAVAVEKILLNTRNQAKLEPFLQWIYPRILALHEYLYRERCPNGDGLVFIRHPWESGIDNSPAWDPPLQAMEIDSKALPPYTRKDTDHVAAWMRPTDRDYDRYVFLVDLFRTLQYDEKEIRQRCPFLIADPLFNSILCRANRSLSNIAEAIGQDPSVPLQWEAATAEGIRDRLWCPERRNFYPFDMVSGNLIYEDTSSGFLPLYAGAATRDQADALYQRIDSLSFCALHQGNCYTIPNYDTRAEGFERANYWRGPVWININWMLADGLARYGYNLKADSLRRDLLQLPIRFGFHEYFDSFTGTGYGSDDFSWTAALFIDLVQEYYRQAPAGRPLRRAFRALTAPAVILNSGTKLPSCPPNELAGELMKSIREMRRDFYDDRRGVVDYASLKGSEAFQHYRTLTNGLRMFDPGDLASEDERLAFWINLYNTVVVDGIVTLDVHRSVLEAPGFFRRARYLIGGRTFSPDDMEHGILRRNARPFGKPFKPFGPLDPRREWMIGSLDPRIHFALVCGSRSCAPIDYYDAGNLNAQLEEAARSFINSSEVMVFPEKKRVLLSEIFKWYEKDFGGRSGIIHFIRRYHASGEIGSYLGAHGPDLQFEYLFYDWNLNRWGR